MKKGDKVYLLVEVYTYDFEQDINTSVFLDKEDACKALADKRDAELANGLYTRFDKKDLEVISNTDTHFDVYLDGRASEYETNIWIDVKEIK